MFLITIASASAGQLTNKSHLNRAEQWIIDQLAKGDIADVRRQYDEYLLKYPSHPLVMALAADEKTLLIHSDFLEKLLTNELPGVKLHRNGIQIVGAVIDGKVDLENATIEHGVRLETCTFTESVNFRGTTFKSSVSFGESTFNKEAIFDGMKIGNNAYFRKSTFVGEVRFIGANITDSFRGDSAHYNNTTTADFSRIKIGSVASFEDTVFLGPVDFSFANVSTAFDAQRAKFRNKDRPAKFTSFTVGFASFEKATFDGPVDFSFANVATSFTANGAHFTNKDWVAQLSMSCKQGTFTGVEFAGPVMFAGSHFSDLRIGDTNVKAPSVINMTLMGSIVTLQPGSPLFETIVAGMQPEPVPILDVDLSATRVTGQLDIRNTRMRDLIAKGLHVDGSANLTNLIIDRAVDLSFSDFAILDLTKSVWPKGTNALRIQGMTYKYVGSIPNNEPESHKALLAFVNQAMYSADVYANLEAFFSRQGYPADADKAFIDGKHRDRKQIPVWKLAWVGSMLLNLLVGYGRHPWQAGIPCGVFVLLGCFLFSEDKMQLQTKPQKGDPPRIYNRFWYSLGLFLPFVDLQADKFWKPKRSCMILRNYVRVHILLGWILIPILLAALTGLIK